MEYYRNFYNIKPNDEIFAQIEKERSKVGYYDLPYQDIKDIKKYAKSIDKKYIVVLGVGGSNLGTRAIYEFLLLANSYNKELLFLETTDPLKIKHLLKKIDFNNSQFVVVSKSGDTIEVIGLFQYINSLVEINNTNCVIISQTGSKLIKFANSNNIKKFELAKNISGRFSVFSAVGLVPLAIIGVDIESLLNGCKDISDSFFNKSYNYNHIVNKARFLTENKNRFNINMIFSYSSSLEYFNKWYVQIWSESLGKININGTRQALTPIALIGPVDQHSFLQLIVDGVRDKTITFIKINNLKGDTIIPELNNFYKNENYIKDISFERLIEEQANATISLVEQQKNIPFDVITIDKVDEFNIAKLMFNYQLTVSTISKFLQIDAYNQPAVEVGKTILKNNIFKNNDK